MSRLRWTWSDVLVGTLLAAVLGGAGLAVAVAADDRDNRTKCAGNLQQIGQAIQQYRDDNGRRFPQVMHEFDAHPVPVWGTPYTADGKPGPVAGANPFAAASPARPKANDVTAALFLLMRTEQIASPAFVCPSTTATEFEFGGGTHTALDWTNWPGDAGLAAHLSYSCANTYCSTTAVQMGFRVDRPDPGFVFLGDLNPGGDDELRATPQSPPDLIHRANSRNHHGEGQNLLYGDNHVDFVTTPFAGVRHDNVYTAGGPEVRAGAKGIDRSHPKVAGCPVDDADTDLIPAASDLDQGK